MESVLCLLFSEADGSLGRSALEAVNVTKDLAGKLPGVAVSVGLIGENVQNGADTLANCGATKFWAAAGSEFTKPRYATDALAAEALCRAAQPSVVVAPASLRVNRVMSGVAHRLGGRVDAHVAGISVNNGTVSVNRWYYRQRMEATLQRTQRPWFLLVEPGSSGAWEGEPGTAKLELATVNVTPECARTTVLGIRELPADAQTIRPEAEVLLVAGAGWTKKQSDGQAHAKDAEKLIADFLKLTRASLGSSKSLVDLGGEGQAVLSFLTHLNQVGQTGSTPRHPKGLATCCHGEEPHTVGWRFISERRAINLDPNCGWARGKADVLYVADAFAVMAKVNELLAQSA
jgi:electron transfer flavoprotein alpha subunit